jgi:glycosyltransferase involved in cell wall biosynthesis
VVVVCYNQAQYLAEAIESALAQQHAPTEIIVVDDGSTDATATVAAAYPVRYIYQDNRGLPAARNTGLRSTSSEYVTFLDADDRLLPCAVSTGLECFRDAPDAAFVFGFFHNIHGDGSLAPTEPEQFVEQDHYFHLLQGNFIGMHGAVLYRRDMLTAAGGFDESLRACEDYELYLRLARRFPVRGHRDLVAEYRKHESNMSRDDAFMLRSVLRVLEREGARATDARHRSAVKRGRRVWKEYYGHRLLSTSKASKNLRAFWHACRAWPLGVLRSFPRAIVRRLLPPSRRSPRLGDLRRLAPFSRQFGFDRGTPVDRYYIESFLEQHAKWVLGAVLEIGDDSYSRRYGGTQITKQDVLHVEPGHPGVTIVANLENAPQIPDSSFDCIIFTQTLHYLFDLDAGLATLRRILKPGGMLLATMPGISQICRDQFDKESDCWRFTATSAERLFSRCFGQTNVSLCRYGNVLTAIALLEGITMEELSKSELDHHDPDYQVTIAVAAMKAD